MDAPHPWFLTGAERGNPASTLARDPAWTEGNAVSPLIHGDPYFATLAEALGPLGPGDHVYLTDWRGDDDQRLDDDGPTLAGLLVNLARRGVEVRGLLWRSHPRAIGFNEEEETELASIVNAAGSQLLLDERVRRAGSHHQKLVVAHHPDRPDEDVAFVGGIDLCHGRRDDVHHLGDLASEHWRATAASLDAWHASGRVGPRPPGRVRRHEPRGVPTWQRLYATPLYRMVVDPDGRPFRLRRRHIF